MLRQILSIVCSVFIYIVIWGAISLISLFNNEYLALIQIWAVFVASACAIQFTSEWFKDVSKDFIYIGFLTLVFLLNLLLIFWINYFYFARFKEIWTADKIDFYVMLAQLVCTYIGARYGKCRADER